MQTRALAFLIEEFSSDPDPPYWVINLIGRLAKAESPDARSFLRSTLERAPTNASAVKTILDQDGVAGVVAVSRSISGFPTDDWDASHVARMAIRHYEDTTMEETPSDSAEELSSEIAALRERVRLFRRDSTSGRSDRKADSNPHHRLKDPSQIPFQDVWSCVERQITTDRVRSTAISTPYGYAIYREWGLHAGDLDFQHAAHELAAQPSTDVVRIARYAQIFAERQFPLDPHPLIDAIETNLDSGGRDYWTDAVGWAVHCCLWALSWFAGPRISEMALELRDRTDHWREYWTLLFPPDEDARYCILIDESLRSESDEEVIHSWGSDLIRRAENLPSPTYVKPLLLFYERNPCGICRGDVVKLLHNLEALPSWIIEECQYDSDEATRDFVASIAESTQRGGLANPGGSDRARG